MSPWKVRNLVATLTIDYTVVILFTVQTINYSLWYRLYRISYTVYETRYIRSLGESTVSYLDSKDTHFLFIQNHQSYACTAETNLLHCETTRKTEFLIFLYQKCCNQTKNKNIGLHGDMQTGYACEGSFIQNETGSSHDETSL